MKSWPRPTNTTYMSLFNWWHIQGNTQNSLDELMAKKGEKVGMKCTVCFATSEILGKFCP